MTHSTKITIEIEAHKVETVSTLLTILHLLNTNALYDAPQQAITEITGTSSIDKIDKSAFWDTHLPTAITTILSAIQYLLIDSGNHSIHNSPLFVSLDNVSGEWENLLRRMTIVQEAIAADFSLDPRRQKQ